jgi:lantibiotic leader peptide-processing serine protease
MPARLKVVVLAAIGVMACAGIAGATTNAASGGSSNTYLVVYKGQSVPSDAATTITQAGGALVYSYDQIGVAVAESSTTSFRDVLLQDAKVDGVSATGAFATQLPDEQTDAGGPPPGDLSNAPAGDSDSLSSLQWDMRQIKTPEAHAITGGSPSVLVGDIDTGIDFHHPDLRANIDVANSVNCVSGAPVQGLAAQDDNGHGTHTAGTIAAASNGIGIVGVAPDVKIAGIKAGDAAGFFFPQAVVCAFYWAATHHVNVTNNSYFADPFLFNCKNDPVQRAIWKAEQRAILFAEQNGVTVVAADGNQSEDMAHPTRDQTSPDNTAPIDRSVTNACAVIPVEVPGVIGVSAVGNQHQDPSDPGSGYLKSFYSSFGVGVTQLTAPGGDSIFGRTAAAANGRVLSTYPPNRPCTRKVTESGDAQEPTAVYCYLQGTSMASPHVAGVAALIISRFGPMAPGRVNAYLGQTADAQSCPAALPAGYASFVGVDDLKVQVCQGGRGSNSWYGSGQVNALNAVTHGH